MKTLLWSSGGEMQGAGPREPAATVAALPEDVPTLVGPQLHARC